jgi:hypothetical protein
VRGFLSRGLEQFCSRQGVLPKLGEHIGYVFLNDLIKNDRVARIIEMDAIADV